MTTWCYPSYTTAMSQDKQLCYQSDDMYSLDLEDDISSLDDDWVVVLEQEPDYTDMRIFMLFGRKFIRHNQHAIGEHVGRIVLVEVIVNSNTNVEQELAEAILEVL